MPQVLDLKIINTLLTKEHRQVGIRFIQQEGIPVIYLMGGEKILHVVRGTDTCASVIKHANNYLNWQKSGIRFEMEKT